MANEKVISRQDLKRQQNSVLPNTSKYPSTLNSNPTPGIQALNEATKLLSQVPFSRVVENATVLENWPPVGELKTRYILPHLNLKSGEVLEDYLLKIRDPIHDEGSKINPEEFLIELKNLDKNSSSSFFNKKPNSFEQINATKQYYDSVATHSTFAPLYSNGLTSAPPAPGTKVRIYYFQEPHISSGHKISGYYEKMYDNDIFEEGFAELKELFKAFRAKFLQAVSVVESIVQQSTGNIASVTGQVSSSSSGPFAVPIPGVPSAIRDYIDSKTESEQYDYFSAFIPLNGGTFRSGLKEKNIVSLRLVTNTRTNSGRGEYDDAFYLIWKDASGNKKVGKYTGNTEPAAYYLDPVNQAKANLNMKHLGRLKPGYITYVTYEHPRRGKILIQKPGTKTAVEIDTNNNGLFDDGYEYQGNPAMMFHPGGAAGKNAFVGSAGCQTMPGSEWNRFIRDVYSIEDPKELGYTIVDESSLKDPDEGKWDREEPKSFGSSSTPEGEASVEQQGNPEETSSEESLS